MKNIRIVVTGGRNFKDKELVFKTLDSINEEHNILELIHGGARGADSLADLWAKEREIRIRKFLPLWERYGSQAGIFRNIEMLKEEPDIVIAFPGGKGTAHMVKSARSKQIGVLDVDELINDEKGQEQNSVKKI